MSDLSRRLLLALVISVAFSLQTVAAQDDATPPAGHDGHGAAATPAPAPTTAGGHGGHAAPTVEPGSVPAAAPNARGNQPLTPTIVDGAKEFRLTTSLVRWSILPGVEVLAYSYNSHVPGPLLRVTAGDRVRIVVQNDLPEPTSVHWHGLVLPNEMDGAAGVTQEPIAPGATFIYEFAIPDSPGTFFYHTHYAADRQQALGLYGALIIDPVAAPADAPDQEVVVELGEWRLEEGQTLPAGDFDGLLPNYFTINGKSYPATETIHAKVGDQILIRFIGTGQFIHPMHIHGGPFQIVATDGFPVPEGAQLTKDTVLVGPGERYDVVWTAREPGRWLLHCHISHHTTNDGVEEEGGGGLTMIIEVSA